MTTQEYNAIFSRNLKKYLNLCKKSQADLARYLDVSTATVNYWCRGSKSPRMDKVDKMCRFLGVKRSDLMEDNLVAAAESSPSSAPKADPILSDRDAALLEKYHSLNSLGMDKLDERVDELCEMEKYKKDTANSVKAG